MIFSQAAQSPMKQAASAKAILDVENTFSWLIAVRNLHCICTAVSACV